MRSLSIYIKKLNNKCEKNHLAAKAKTKQR